MKSYTFLYCSNAPARLAMAGVMEHASSRRKAPVGKQEPKVRQGADPPNLDSLPLTKSARKRAAKRKKLAGRADDASDGGSVRGPPASPALSAASSAGASGGQSARTRCGKKHGVRKRNQEKLALTRGNNSACEEAAAPPLGLNPHQDGEEPAKRKRRRGAGPRGDAGATGGAKVFRVDSQEDEEEPVKGKKSRGEAGPPRKNALRGKEAPAAVLQERVQQKREKLDTASPAVLDK